MINPIQVRVGRDISLSFCKDLSPYFLKDYSYIYRIHANCLSFQYFLLIRLSEWAPGISLDCASPLFILGELISFIQPQIEPFFFFFFWLSLWPAPPLSEHLHTCSYLIFTTNGVPCFIWIPQGFIACLIYRRSSKPVFIELNCY